MTDDAAIRVRVAHPHEIAKADGRRTLPRPLRMTSATRATRACCHYRYRDNPSTGTVVASLIDGPGG